MATAKKRALVFDFDGVVADSWKLHEACWREVLKRHGAALDDDALEKAIGWTSQETAEVLVRELDLKVDATELGDEKSALMMERFDDQMPVMPGIVAATERLKDDFRLAVTAGRTVRLVQPALERYGLGDTFELVLTRDDRKPDEELDDLLVRVPAEFKIKPDQCAMVDDSRNGLLAAERAGMKSIAFDSNPKHEHDYSMADAVVNSLDELVPELMNAVLAN
jgi:HAD superfamily hydrolase (TIGR01509 family)